MDSEEIDYAADVLSLLLCFETIWILCIWHVLSWPQVLFLHEGGNYSHSTGSENVLVKRYILGGVSLEKAHILPTSALLPAHKGGVNFVC